MTIIPFRYAGGKFYALKILKPFWEAVNHDEYREPFVGGGSVFFKKSKVKYSWINDIDKDLITTYKVMADPLQRKKLVYLVSKEKATPERHKQVNNMKPTNDFRRAYKYFYLNRTSFSGKMKNPSWGYRPVRSLPPERWYERIIPCGEKLSGVNITNIDFEEVIRAPAKGETVLMFIDPPYFLEKNNSHYSHSFKLKDHIRLMEVLRENPHYFFLTYQESDKIRELYDWAYIYPTEFFYRIDNSQNNEGKRQKGMELIITNYKLPKTPQQSTLSSYTDINRTVGNKISLSSNDKRTGIKKIRSPLRFPGSKYQAIKFIKPVWEKIFHDEYREPFFGGGAVFFAKQKVEENWLNDIDKELITTFKIIQNPETRMILIDKLKDEMATKERHLEMKEWKPKEDIDIAYRYFYLNRTSYSGIMKKPAWGYHTKKSVPPKKWGERIDIAGKKLEGVKITSLDYHDVIESPSTGSEVFLFVDPPYYAADQKRAYQFSFTIKDHKEVCSVLRKTEFKFCLTYDDHDDIKNMYQWANIHPVSWRYHTANSNKASRKMGSELIITNF